jgi:pyruvate ferredoxin oxidoreductase alpha subunit/phenylglyoxylate dehydrogenase alpha subunit
MTELTGSNLTGTDLPDSQAGGAEAAGAGEADACLTGFDLIEAINSGAAAAAGGSRADAPQAGSANPTALAVRPCASVAGASSPGDAVKAVTGNTAAALGAALCRPDLIAAYPITPQSSVVEYLAGLVADGRLDATMIEVESEHSAMSVVQGAAAAGGRVFTATSAQGLALMYEPYFRMSTLRLPMVMAVACREMTSPQSIWSGQQDVMSVREAGWIQIHAENNQEILDLVIQAHRLAEDPEILVPVNVCYDGFFLSHLFERVAVPSQAKVDRFLADRPPRRPLLDPREVRSLDPMTPGGLLMKYRRGHMAALQRALVQAGPLDDRFGEIFGRSWGGPIEPYRLDDADHALLTIGSMTGTAREAVDLARDEGLKIGLIKVRYMRPFPGEAIAAALAGRKGWASVDRSVSFGFDCGPVFAEVLAAQARASLGFYASGLTGTDSPGTDLSGPDMAAPGSPSPDLAASDPAPDSAGKPAPGFSIIGALGGADISLDEMSASIRKLCSGGFRPGETHWLDKRA